MNNVLWIPQRDEEYNQQFAVRLQGHFTIWSDKDAGMWDLETPDGDITRLDADNEYDAKTEAAVLIRDYCQEHPRALDELEEYKRRHGHDWVNPS